MLRFTLLVHQPRLCRRPWLHGHGSARTWKHSNQPHVETNDELPRFPPIIQTMGDTMSKPFSRSRVSLAVSAALSVTVVLGEGIRNVSAQQAERVIITGSNIPRAQTETASPVISISREAIGASAKATVPQYLEPLSVDGQGPLRTSFGIGFAAGSTGISLRGMGTTSTLVLVNGRRLAPYGRADAGPKVVTGLR